MKYLGTILLSTIITHAAVLNAQDPARVKADCQKRLDDIRHKVEDLNRNYEQTTADLRNGHFCSDCRRSRTELQASGINFAAHIQEGAAGGRHVVAASQEDFSKAYNRYKAAYDAEQRKFEQLKASCESRVNLAVEAENKRLEEERNRQAEARENARKELEEKQNQERQRALEERQRIAEQQEQARQQALRDLQAQIDKQREESLESIASSTQDITDDARQKGEQMRNSISQMNTGRGEQIAFNQATRVSGQQVTSSDIGSLDDFDVSKYEQMKEDFDRWHEQTVRYLREHEATYEEQQTYERYSNELGDDERAFKTYRLFDKARTAFNTAADRLSNLRQGVRDFILEAEGVGSNTVEGWSDYATDRSMDHLIDATTSGYRKRSLHYAKGVTDALYEGNMRQISSVTDHVFGDADTEIYEYDPRTAFVGNAHVIGNGSSFKDLYDFAESVKSAPTIRAKVRAMGIFIYRKWRD